MTFRFDCIDKSPEGNFAFSQCDGCRVDVTIKSELLTWKLFKTFYRAVRKVDVHTFYCISDCIMSDEEILKCAQRANNSGLTFYMTQSALDCMVIKFDSVMSEDIIKELKSFIKVCFAKEKVRQG